MGTKIESLLENIKNNDLDPIEKIKCCIDSNFPYVLQGGAGSGKTYTLGKIIEYIFSKESSNNVLCITYTNVAKDEVIERFPYKNLEVYTIHEFCWRCINQYQESIINYFKENLNDKGLDLGNITKIVYDIASSDNSSYIDKKNNNILKISHNDILKLSYGIFHSHDKIKKIFIDSYPYVLVDEYQDTNKNVIKLLLEEIYIYSKSLNSKISIGFYGDPVQSIYSDGLDLSEYVYPSHQDIELFVIDKKDNYRCSIAVINMINNLRGEIGVDNITQSPALDNKEGEVTIIETSELDDYLKALEGKNVKVLYLTHKIIAERAKFSSLYALYNELFYKDKNDKFKSLSLSEKLVKKDKNDVLTSMLFKLCNFLYLYECNNINKILKNNDIRVNDLKDLSNIKTVFNSILENKERLTIKQFLGKMNELGLSLDGANLKKFTSKETKYYKINSEGVKAPYQMADLYNDILKVSFDELYNVFQYVYNIDSYSTQHNVKGAEFDNVVVVLDEFGWTKYNYEGSILNQSKETVIDRTLKLLYVSMSRAKDGLTLCLKDRSEARLSNKISKWKEPI